MKNYKITFLLFAIFLFLGVKNLHAQSNEIYSNVKLSYDVDGLDIWELPAPRTTEVVSLAVDAFEKRCASDVPAYYLKRIGAIGLSLEDFDIQTKKSLFYYRGYGDSHRCRLDAVVKKRDFYNFKTTKTPHYHELNGVSAFDQCKAFRDNLDAQADDLNLFDRIIKLVWGKRNGKPVIASCFVTYTSIIQI